VAAGEASLFLRVSSGHRGAAYEASAWIVSELKKKVPIWKRPLFVRQEAHEVAGG
jgi:molybdopterin synthase catalytic subunit